MAAHAMAASGEASAGPAGAGTTGTDGVLAVTVAGEFFALPAAAVREVLRPLPLTRVPQAPPALLGLANLRGRVLPVLSLAGLMGLRAEEASPAARVVVVEGLPALGLLVGRVGRLGPAEGARPVDLPALLGRAFVRSGVPVRGAVIPAGPVQEMAAEAAERLALVAFGIAGQDFALPLDAVAEVVRLPAAVTALPRAGEAMLGVVAHRGGLLPVVSAHALLGFPATETRSARVVVTRLGAHRLGLVVDRMKAILRVPEATIEPVPPLLSRGLGEARVAAILRMEGGRRLVSVLSPAGLFDEATVARLGAAATEGEAMDGDGGAGAVERFVIFRLGEEHYGLPIAAVDEVVRHPGALTRIPHAPDFVEGAMNLRGAVLPVIDQRRRFGAGEAGGRGRIVVVTVDGLRAGFAVDAASEVLAVTAAELSPAPELAEGRARVFDRVARVERGGRMILLVDPRALLDAAERDLLAAMSARAAERP